MAASTAETATELAALPLADLVAAHLDGVTSIVEMTDPAVGLDLRLDLDSAGPDGIGYRRVEPAAWLSSTPARWSRPGRIRTGPGRSSGRFSVTFPGARAVSCCSAFRPRSCPATRFSACWPTGIA